VNEAYARLRDQAARGEYLLGLSGIESLSETDTQMPADFLIEQMERREAIDEARAEGDHAALERALDDIGDERKALDAELAEAIDARQALDEARTLVRKLRFLDRVKSEITDALIAIEA
jgi:molecular chaperone HscB